MDQIGRKMADILGVPKEMELVCFLPVGKPAEAAKRPGKKPFDGDTPVSIALMHMQSTPKKPTEINSTIPEGLEQIILRAMQKEPNQRYQTAGEMIKDMEELKKATRRYAKRQITWFSQKASFFPLLCDRDGEPKRFEEIVNNAQKLFSL